jgi:hypothetical protein
MIARKVVDAQVPGYPSRRQMLARCVIAGAAAVGVSGVVGCDRLRPVPLGGVIVTDGNPPETPETLEKPPGPVKPSDQ